MAEFIPGQRCISDAELQMGLGTILTVEERTLTVLFMATGDTRTYAKQTAPLTRVLFSIGDSVSSKIMALLPTPALTATAIIARLRSLNWIILFS
jgi:ATP-dependent helicase HepA